MLLINKANYLLIGFICFSSFYTTAQDQKLADSLLIVYNEGKLSGLERLELLRSLSFNETNDFDLALMVAQELIELAYKEKKGLYLYDGHLQVGNVYRLLGSYDLSLDAYFKSVEAAINAEHLYGEGSSYGTIADVYSEMGNTANAEIYYEKSIQLLRKTNNPIPLATILLNAGDEYFNSKKFKKALQYFEESGQLFEKANYLLGTAYNLGNIGMVYAEKGNDNLAKENINRAIEILEDSEDYYAISEYLTYMADIYHKQGKITTAVEYSQRSLDLAQNQGLKKQLSETNLQLSEFYEALGNPEASLNHYKAHITFRDSILNLEIIQKNAALRNNHEISQRQAKLDLANQQKRNQLIILGFTGFLLLSVFWYYRTISKEKKRSEKLLLNILPEETALELKQNGKVQAKKFDSVTVLFTDFKGFTSYAEGLSPEELVETVDFYFSEFDKIMDKYGLEKIKTIGDAYMSAGGLHGDKQNHVHKMIMAAFEIVEFVKNHKSKSSGNHAKFDIRVGINTGPVVAGVVGTHKFAYDIWGDTVNIASRMESNSEPGKINISDNTYELIKEEFDCEFRGELEAKNRGQLKMYFVNAKKELQLNSVS